MGNKSRNLPHCSSLQPEVVYNFSEIQSTFKVTATGFEPTTTLLFSNFVAECLNLHGMVSISLKRTVKYEYSSTKGIILDLLIFLLYILESGCCSKYSGKTTNFSILNLFLHFLHLLIIKHNRIFVTVM